MKRALASTVSIGLLITSLSLDATAAPMCLGARVTINLITTPGASATAGNDVILGTVLDDTIEALAGNDRICSGRGNDAIDAGEGDDRIRGESGEDQIEGGPGNDRIIGGPDADFLVGDTYAQTGDVTSSAGDDVILGGRGIFGPAFSEEVVYGDHYALDGSATGGGHDRLDGGRDGAAIIVGDNFAREDATGGGNDRITRGKYVIGDNFISNDGKPGTTPHAIGSGNDVISKLMSTPLASLFVVGDNRVETDFPGVPVTAANGPGAATGNDRIYGNGRTVLIGDHLVLGSIVMPVATGAGADVIVGRRDRFLPAYVERIFGDHVLLTTSATLGPAGGSDRINGGPGNDMIFGGPQDDDIDGGIGGAAVTDECSGEAGSDSFRRCETANQ